MWAHRNAQDDSVRARLRQSDYLDAEGNLVARELLQAIGPTPFPQQH